MNLIAAGGLLEAWEQGQTQHPLHRALTLLRIGEPDQTIDGLASLSIGERDRRLLALRCRFFGSRFEAVATCPICKEVLDLAFSADQLLEPPSNPTADLHLDGRNVQVRLPNTIDLLEAAMAPPERRTLVLLERCAGPGLSPEDARGVQEMMGTLDPMAEIELQLACPECGHEWAEPFDIASYLWAEASDGALRLLREIHILAHAYGWKESKILSMHPRRRRVYLDLVMGA